MKLWSNKSHCLVLLLLLFAASCTPPQQTPQVQETVDPEKTIGSVSQIYYYESIPVRGIGIVAGLNGTGSSECPPSVRESLEKYIWKQLPNNTINARAFIESKNTAVVEVFGVIPALSSDRDAFDVAVRPLSISQTTSLDGGHLYATELKELSRLTSLQQFSMFSKTLATVEGPIYSNKLKSSSEESGVWYVLGGAKPEQSAEIRLILNRPDFLTANAIRNRINERFKSKTVIPVSDAELILRIPSEYVKRKEQFLEMVKTLQLGDVPAIKHERVNELIQQLLEQPDNQAIELALEAIGRSTLDSLVPLLDSPNESVRFHATRCIFHIGENRAIKPLREILLDPTSQFRIPAIEAIGQESGRTEANAILTISLNDPDIQVRLAAYEALLRMGSPAISRKIIAGDFVVDNIVCPGPKIIYAYQQKTPRIALFGSPVYCNKNIFIQSNDGTVTINSKAGDEFLSVSRTHPQRPRVIGPLKANFEVSSLIQVLGEQPEIKNRVKALPGLAVSYAQILPILEKMCENNAISAEFIAGPAAAVDPVLQNLPPISR